MSEEKKKSIFDKIVDMNNFINNFWIQMKKLQRDKYYKIEAPESLNSKELKELDDAFEKAWMYDDLNR